MSERPVVCDFCHKLRDDSHDMLACSDVIAHIADMNNLRKLKRLDHGREELLDLAKQARQRKIVYSDDTPADRAVCDELEIVARVAEGKAAKLSD